MTVEPEPDIGRALELVLQDPAPPYGARARVRRAVDERLTPARAARVRLQIALVASLAVALGLFMGVQIAPRSTDAKGSALTLRSARVLLRPNTEMVVDRDDEGGSSLQLVAGTVLIHVQKGTGKAFEVVTGTTRVQVTGTIFGVSRGVGESVIVEVVEGVVEVTDPAGTRRLTEGTRWPAGATLFDDPSDLRQLRAPMRVEPFRPLAGGMSLQQNPQAPPAGSAVKGPADGGVGLSVVERRTSNSAGSPALSDGEKAYAQAKNLERMGAEDAALAAYQRLSGRGDAVAEDALFSVLRLRVTRGERPAALAAVAEYRGRFPSGRYGRDVDVQALNLRVGDGDEGSALREIEAFLTRFPNDARAWRFRLVRASVRAAHGDCANALLDLRDVPPSNGNQAISDRCRKR